MQIQGIQLPDLSITATFSYHQNCKDGNKKYIASLILPVQELNII